MVLLIAFALLAGAATAVSPCVLPVLPLALSAGVTGGERRPLGIVTGLAASFTFATIALVYLISALGLPNSLLRTAAIAALMVFGLTLLVPPLGARVEASIGRLSAKVKVGKASGFWSGLIVGAGLGLVYAPCAGPILAGVITVSASQPLGAQRLAVALAYALGSSVVLYLLMLGGRRLISRLSRRVGPLQIAMGALMVLTGALMLGNYDTRFETAIASDLPAFLVSPTHGLESSTAAERQLAALRGHAAGKGGQAIGLAPARDGAKLPLLGRAPDFTGTGRWFNTPAGQPLTLASLRGRVVLVDFWTYSCINCLRTLPYLRAWDAEYRAKGLTIVGVHTPEFPFEKSSSNVETAVRQNSLRYPVAQDNSYATWDAYQNQYWPAEYLIDAAGQVRLASFGEGDYATTERAIRALLSANARARLRAPARVRAERPSQQDLTPESYLGSAHAERFVNAPIGDGTHDYGRPPRQPLPLSGLRYGGRWQITPQAALAVSGASLELRFRARRVFSVLGSPATPRPLRVLLDGRPIPASLAGSDVRRASASVAFQRLYRLVDLPRVETHTLTLQFAPGVSGFAFTFG